MSDREKLIALIEDAYYCSILELADHLIANGVVVREKGEWKKVSFLLRTSSICDKCHDYYSMPTNFCPNCGADMRKGENG